MVSKLDRYKRLILAGVRHSSSLQFQSGASPLFSLLNSRAAAADMKCLVVVFMAAVAVSADVRDVLRNSRQAVLLQPQQLGGLGGLQFQQRPQQVQLQLPQPLLLRQQQGPQIQFQDQFQPQQQVFQPQQQVFQPQQQAFQPQQQVFQAPQQVFQAPQQVFQPQQQILQPQPAFQSAQRSEPFWRILKHTQETDPAGFYRFRSP
ncbi:hypothetical protein FOCC_FOCC012126 [Frankliniella occidentalis]|nr:hypothetical protein FOCC_FOCC012126 [Frankliniella occidentalis]